MRCNTKFRILWGIRAFPPGPIYPASTFTGSGTILISFSQLTEFLPLGIQSHLQSETADSLNPKRFSKHCIYPIPVTRMRHKVETYAENPSVPTRENGQILHSPPQRFRDRIVSLSVFHSCVSVAGRRPDRVSLCSKRESLKIANQSHRQATICLIPKKFCKLGIYPISLHKAGCGTRPLFKMGAFRACTLR